MNWIINKITKILDSWTGIIILVTVGLVFIASCAYGGFVIKRWFNWNYAYQDDVIELIYENVKKECLK